MPGDDVLFFSRQIRGAPLFFGSGRTGLRGPGVRPPLRDRTGAGRRGDALSLARKLSKKARAFREFARSTWAPLMLPGLREETRSVRRFVFCATTGRSATGTLGSFLGTLPGVVAFHEPRPVMNGEILQAACRGDNAPVARAWRRRKLPQILEDARGHEFYVETNHLFLKSFCDLALAEFAERLAVIHVVRSAASVAKSFFELGEIPSADTRWLLIPEAPTNLVPWSLLAQHGLSHGFYDCLWYWLETEARSRALKQANPGLLWVDIETEDFNSPEKMSRLATALGIDSRNAQAFEAVPRLNRKKTHKERANERRLEPPMVETMFERFREVYQGTPYGDLLVSRQRGTG